MTQTNASSPRPQIRHLNKGLDLRAVTIVGGMIIAAILIASYVYLRSQYAGEAADEANQRLSLHQAFLTAELEKYQYLPHVLANDPTILSALKQGVDGNINHKLAQFAEKSGAAALYLMQADGLTIASSNHDQSTSFIGNNYSFRPYFQDALKGKDGAFFAVGVTTLTRGMFYSSPVYDLSTDGQPILGVMAVKVDFSPLEQSWRDSRETVFVSDEHGIVVLSSNARWLYKHLKALPDKSRQHIKRVRQFADNKLAALDLVQTGDGRAGEIILEKTRYIHQTRNMKQQGWTLHYLSPAAEVQQASLLVLALEGLGLTIVAAILLSLRARTLKKESLRAMADANAQRKLNLRLEQEVDERRRTEQELRATQDNLIHASKMASLGHMSATISHEINQHIAAALTFAAGAKLLVGKGDINEAGKNIDRIKGLMQRMTAITRQLKAFSRKSEQSLQPVDVQKALTGALSIAEPRLKDQNVYVTIKPFSNPVSILGDQVQLEQVFLNLVQNAIDAMRDSKKRQLNLTLTRYSDYIRVTCQDTGSGLPLDVADKMFDPFVTTKAHGDGLGLGLAISTKIIESFGGTISAINAEQGGAQVEVSLPAINASTSASIARNQPS